MQQLISIETIPISIKYVDRALPPAAKETNGKQTAPNKEAGIKELEDFPKVDSFVKSYTAGIHNLTYTATAQIDEEGKPRLNINISGDTANEFSFYRFNRDIHNMISRILKAGSEISNNDGGASITLPDFRIEILEKPEVIIKYVGGPIYIPKSADPKYDSSKEVTLQD